MRIFGVWMVRVKPGLNMALCLTIQSLMFARAIAHYSRHDNLVRSPLDVAGLAVINGVTLLPFVGKIMQIAILALLFECLGAFPSFEDIFCHPVFNFATLD